VVVDEGLKFESHVAAVQTKITKFLSIVYRAKEYLSKSVMRLVMLAFVYPHVMYGLGIWGLTYKIYLNPLIVTLNRFVKMICHIHPWDSPAPGYAALRLDNIDTLLKIRLAVRVKNLLINKHKCVHVAFKLPMPNARNTRALVAAKLVPTTPSTANPRRMMEHVGAHLWNALPLSITEINVLDRFKKELKYYIRNNNIELSIPSVQLVTHNVRNY
jgi:hypothetical protein